jgi:alanine racemase
MVRAGIYLYGGDPAEAAGEYEPPAPVVSVRARVVLVRDVPAGATCGYGATHTAAAPARWATLAIGYGDGLPRALGNRGQALVRGRRVPIIGRISMDLTVVDITGLEGVAPGEVATLLGRDGDEAITVEELAALADTISYEILTGFTPRLPRVGRENE